MDTESTTLPQDTAFDLLSNGRRRLLLQRLQGTDGVELGELATELAAIENDVPPEELSAQQRKRTYVSLYQTHVPKLENAGVVTFDSESGIVGPTDRVDELVKYFNTETSDVAWDRLYLVVGVVGLLVYVSASLLGNQIVRPLYVGIAVLVGVVVVSLFHRRYENGSESTEASISQ
ncbi:hypothetical protein [Natronomonas sp.]|uniref:DUF7344 domain-containing protein n=1 Tax=Natronomonas sp. TaxID=2184060 RepID=UPI0039768872